MVVGFFAGFFAIVARLYFSRYRLSFGSELALYLCLMLLVALAVAPGFPVSRALIQGRVSSGRVMPLLIGCWVVPYLIYAFGCADFRWNGLVCLLALSALPLLVYFAAPVQNLSVVSWQDAIVWIWIVVAMVLRQWNGIWNVPVNLDFMGRLFMIVVASWCWVFVRPVPGLAYNFSISAKTIRAVALNLAGFAVIAVPASLAMHFASWNPHWRGLQAFWISYVEIFIFIAWLEELLL